MRGTRRTTERNGRYGVEIANPATPSTRASHNQSFHRLCIRFVSCKAERLNKQASGSALCKLLHVIRRPLSVKPASSKCQVSYNDPSTRLIQASHETPLFLLPRLHCSYQTPPVSKTEIDDHITQGSIIRACAAAKCSFRTQFFVFAH